jgi:hypothetical protein
MEKQGPSPDGTGADGSFGSVCMEEKGANGPSSQVSPVASAVLDLADPGRNCPTGHAQRGPRSGGTTTHLVRLTRLGLV